MACSAASRTTPTRCRIRPSPWPSTCTAHGYQTAVFTSNVYAGTMSSLDRGVDVLREAGTEPNSASSRELHANFWQWREAYPAEPYWVHFQTTDVHWPWKPLAPFAGLYVAPERRQRFYDWERQVGEARGFSGPSWPVPRISPEIFEEIGISRQAFYGVARDLYDETMTHNDYQLGRLVERLKATGEWQHTLLIVAADHGTNNSAGLLEPMPDRWGASYYSYAQRIPMVIVWPERIAPGQRFPGPVSMIDMLPTTPDRGNRRPLGRVSRHRPTIAKRRPTPGPEKATAAAVRPLGQPPLRRQRARATPRLGGQVHEVPPKGVGATRSTTTTLHPIGRAGAHTGATQNPTLARVHPVKRR